VTDKPMTVLIVDDEQHLSSLIKSVLASTHSVVVVASPPKRSDVAFEVHSAVPINLQIKPSVLHAECHPLAKRKNYKKHR
jgi:CheY-like chemotaxis protein